MLTKSTGIKNICRGKLGFLKFSAFYKGKHTLDYSDWAAVYKEKTVPRDVFDFNGFISQNTSSFRNNYPSGGVLSTPQFRILGHPAGGSWWWHWAEERGVMRSKHAETLSWMSRVSLGNYGCSSVTIAGDQVCGPRGLVTCPDVTPLSHELSLSPSHPSPAAQLFSVRHSLSWWQSPVTRNTASRDHWCQKKNKLTIIYTRTTTSRYVLTLYWDWIFYRSDWGHLNV